MSFTPDDRARFAHFAAAAGALVGAVEAYQALAIPPDAVPKPEELKPVEDAFGQAAELADACGWPTMELFNRGAVGAGLFMLARAPRWLERVRLHAQAARILSQGRPDTLRNLRTCLSAVQSDSTLRERVMESLPREVRTALDRAARRLSADRDSIRCDDDLDVLADELIDNQGRDEDEVWGKMNLTEVVGLLKSQAPKAGHVPLPERPAIISLGNRVYRLDGDRQGGRTDPLPGDGLSGPPEPTRRGAIPPDRFVWGQHSMDRLSLDQWRLLECLCDGDRLRAGVPLETVIAHVYGQKKSGPSDRGRALQELRRRTERKLHRGGVPLAFDLTNGLLRLLTLPAR
jgi:hypothetical protein